MQPAFEERAPDQQDDADHPASHHGADDAVGKLNVAMRQARHVNGHGQLVEVNQIEDGFPKAWCNQQGQTQYDDDCRRTLDEA